MAYYPRADRGAQWFGDTYPGEPITPSRIVLHSTETVGWPSYDGGASAPHLTVRADFAEQKLTWRQHLRLDRNARALRNPEGGVETNRQGAIQVEIVGTCNRKHPDADRTLRTWDLPSWALDGLATFIRWCHDEYGIPLRAWGTPWPAYPKDCVRMTGPQWNAFRGVCGHQHVPENTHGDPGDVDIIEILRRAGADVEAQKVWDCDTIPNENADGTPVNPDNPVVQADYALGLTLKHARGARFGVEECLAILARIEKRLDELERPYVAG